MLYSLKGVAVSGVVIDVNSIPKSNLISLKAVEGPEAVQKCHVVSMSGACAQVSDEGLTLQEKLHDESCEDQQTHFLFFDVVKLFSLKTSKGPFTSK